MIKTAIRSDDPVIFYEHKRLYRLLKAEVPETDYTVPIDKANVIREGDDLTGDCIWGGAPTCLNCCGEAGR